MKKGKIAMGIIIFIIAVLLLIGVPICINLCFKPENRWTAGNVLTYYGTTLSFLGTVTFSTLSIYHTKQIKEETSKREEMVKDMQLKMNAPILKCCISGSSGNYQNLYMTFSNKSDNIADNIEIGPLYFLSDEKTIIAKSTGMDRELDVLQANANETIHFSNPSISGENIELQFDLKCTDKFANKIVYRAICKIPESSKLVEKVKLIQM